jgi:hypothetical protein
VDILSSLEGISFSECWPRRKTECIKGEQMHFLALDDLIENKKRTGRPQDQIDVSALEKMRQRQLG